MGRLTWPLRPLPDGRGEVWRWNLGGLAELPAARAGLRSRLGVVGVQASDEDTAGGRDPASGGLGLHLVARLSVAHGWYVDDGFKHVWACLPTAMENRQPALA